MGEGRGIGSKSCCSGRQVQGLFTLTRLQLVEITLFAGRSLQAKRALYQAIVRRFGALGIAASDVVIVLNEVPLDNWGIRGGKPTSEVDLGFKVNV